MNKIAFITGATAGIGEATAILFAQKGYDVIITGRRTERLDLLSEKIKASYSVNVLSLCFDIRNQHATENAVASMPDAWKKIEVLVNNAGLASGLSSIQNGDVNDWEVMIDTNIKGLLYISKAIMALMIANGKGHIVNIGSIAGKEAYLNGNVYCATKHAVDALSKSMRIDLLPHGIKVTAIHPGMVDTEFSLVRFKGDTQRAKTVYEQLEPLHAEDVADAIVYAVTRPSHVNINDMLIMPAIQANTSHIVKGK